MPSVSIGVKSAALLGSAFGQSLLNRVWTGGSPVPVRADDVTPGWLEKALGLPTGSLISVSVASQDSGTAGRALLDVQGKPGVDVPSRVFLKLTPLDLLQSVQMTFMDLGAREVLFYNALAESVPIRVPRCYSAQIDTRRGRNIMAFEDLGPTALFRDVRSAVTQAEAEAVVDGLADLHAAYWESPRFNTDLKPITFRTETVNTLGNTLRRRLMTKLPEPVRASIPDDVFEQSRIWFERADEITDFMARQPRTVTHGDPHLGNLFFEGATPGWLDWQMVMAVPGMRDVSYFCTMSVAPDMLRSIEKDLVRRYVDRLGSLGVETDFDQQWTLYRAMVAAPYGSAIAAASVNGRSQVMEIAMEGLARCVAGVQAHDSFRLLGALLDGQAG